LSAIERLRELSAVGNPMRIVELFKAARDVVAEHDVGRCEAVVGELCDDDHKTLDACRDRGVFAPASPALSASGLLSQRARLAFDLDKVRGENEKLRAENLRDLEDLRGELDLLVIELGRVRSERDAARCELRSMTNFAGLCVALLVVFVVALVLTWEGVL
jgi:hypothetical protein